MNAGSEDRVLVVARYQIVCLSCGYHRAWPTLVDAHADGHHHHAEHTALRPRQATGGDGERPLEVASSSPGPTETRERICPQCRSADILALGRILADKTGIIRRAYQCRDCSKEFVVPPLSR